MTDRNHRRGTTGRTTRPGSARCRYGALPVGEAKSWQRIRHKQRRQLVRKLIHHERIDDIPANTPRHVRWDYW